MKIEEIKDYVGSLLPGFKRSELSNDIEATRDELLNQTLPPLNAALEERVFGESFKSEWCRDTDRVITGRLRGQRGNYLEIAQRVLSQFPDKLDWLEKEIQKSFDTTISGVGLTFPKTTLIHLTEAYGFVVRYTRRLLLATYGFEIPKVDKGSDVDFPLSKAELTALDDQMLTYVWYLGILTNSKEKIASAINSAPDVVVDLNTLDSVAEVHGEDTVDPLHAGFIKHTWNPIYHVRLAIAEWQAARYHAAVEERKALELRLLHLKMARSGSKDAALEKQIHYQESRVQKMNIEILEMEKAAGLRK